MEDVFYVFHILIIYDIILERVIFGVFMKQESSKSQNLRFIIVTVLVGLVILGIAIWAITFVVSNSKKNVSSGNNTTTSITADTSSDNTTTTPSTVATEDQSGSTTSTTSTTDTVVTDASVVTPPPAVTPTSTVPETGPEEVLPFALIAGTSIAYVLSKRF